LIAFSARRGLDGFAARVRVRGGQSAGAETASPCADARMILRVEVLPCALSSPRR
jgi:hypothetical protein